MCAKAWGGGLGHGGGPEWLQVVLTREERPGEQGQPVEDSGAVYLIHLCWESPKDFYSLFFLAMLLEMELRTSPTQESTLH